MAFSGLAQNNWHMAFRSPDGLVNVSSPHQSIMGAGRGFNQAAIGHTLGKAYFSVGGSGSQQVSPSNKSSYVSSFKNPMKTYAGCAMKAGSFLPSPPNESVLQSECEDTKGGICSFVSEDLTNNNKIYGFEESSSNSLTSSFFGDHVANITHDVTGKMQGLYSLSFSNVSGSSTELRAKMHKDGYLINDTYLSKSYPPPSGDEIAIFGKKNQGVIHPAAGGLSVNFYSLGYGPDVSSSQNPDGIDENFLPDKMNHFLNQLDRDLKRGDYSVHSSTPTITSELDSEVADWANNRVPRAGGRLSESIVKATDTFMKAIKSQSGLREKLYRCNLFAGTNLHASLVPLISDAGHAVDVNKGDIKFLEADYDIKIGLAPNFTSGGDAGWLADKYLDTGLKAGNLLTSTAGHMSISTSDTARKRIGNYPPMVPISLLDEESNGSKGNTFMGFHDDSGNVVAFNNIWGKSNAAVTTQWKAVPLLTDFPQNQLFLMNAANNSVYGKHVLTYINGTNHQADHRHGAGEAELPKNSTVTLFAKAFGKDINHDKQGGLISPSRSSLVPILLDDGKYYIFALTEEEYTLSNLVDPSGFPKTEIIEKYIHDKYGYRWDTVNYSNISSLWATTGLDNNLQLGRLLQDLKHEHQYDKPVGWLDIENAEGYASSVSSYETRLLFHNNKSKGINSNYNIATNTASNTSVRNVVRTKKDKACLNCSPASTKGPLLIKTEVSDPSANPPDVYQSWDMSISFYSIGGSLDATEISVLNTAYKAFAASVGRTISGY